MNESKCVGLRLRLNCRIYLHGDRRFSFIYYIYLFLILLIIIIVITNVCCARVLLCTLSYFRTQNRDGHMMAALYTLLEFSVKLDTSLRFDSEFFFLVAMMVCVSAHAIYIDDE